MKEADVEQEKLVVKIHHLLMHSIGEMIFYDRATDYIAAPELKSAMARYLWIRNEHIMGIRSFLRSTDLPRPVIEAPYAINERFWHFFLDAVKRKDNQAILKMARRSARLTLKKYAGTLLLIKEKNRLQRMLSHHLCEIKGILRELSAIPADRMVP